MVNTLELIERMCSKFELSDETQRIMKSDGYPNDSGQHVAGRGCGSVIGLTAVSTFVAKKGFGSFYVPSFASHWGIVCDFPVGGRWLFHLVYSPEDRSVAFRSQTWEQKWMIYQVERVGTSQYGIGEIKDIGSLNADSILMI